MALLAPIPPGPELVVSSSVLSIGTLVLAAVWYRSWLIVIDRTHKWLLRHPELGDGKRVLGFFAALLEYPLVIGVLVLAVLVGLDAAS